MNSTTNSEPRRVFVVEDEAPIAMELRDRLVRLGYFVCGSTGRGEDAFQQVADARPDLVLMDIHLGGGWSGIETASRLRELGEIPVVFLTAQSDSELVRKEVDLHPFGYLVKPFDERELHATVEMALYRHRMERKLSERTKQLEDANRHLSFAEFSLQHVAAGFVWFARDGRILRTNKAHCEMLGYTEAELLGMGVYDLERDLSAEAWDTHWKSIQNQKYLKTERIAHRKDGSAFVVEVDVHYLEFGGDEFNFTCVRDITSRKKAEEREHHRTRILEALTSGTPLPAILESIVLTLESALPRAICSILILDKEEGCLLHGAAPSLPEFYNRAVTGLKIGNGVGSCGTAAFLAERVIAEDVLIHPYWEGFRELARDAGLRACWSQPIFSTAKEVLGTFAIYHREPHSPGASELQELDIAAGYAALAIERKQAEDSRREQEAWHKAVLEAWPDMIFVSDAKGRIKEYHASQPELLQLSRSEFIGKSNTEIFPAELAARLEHGRKSALQNGGVCSVEYEATVPTGERHFEARFVRYGLCETLAMVSDITDRKRSEAALEKSRERFEYLFELAPDALVITDRNGLITLVNRSFEVMFEWPREELLGRPVEVLVPKGLQDGHRELHEEYFAWADVRLPGAGRPRLQAVRKSGRSFPAEINLSPIEMDEGSAILASIRDLSDRVESERRALRSQRLESLGTLASGVAHDLNNTFVPILIAVDMLKEKAQLPGHYLELIENGAHRGAAMVRQLLAFAKGEAGRRVSVDPKQLIDDMDRMIRSTFPKSIRLDVHCPSNCPAISGDSTQLHQVLLNLCVNARDAMPDGGLLRLLVEGLHFEKAMGSFTDEIKPGYYVRITVADTGAGIAPENLDRIFEPFFTTKAPHSGSGLGLAAVMGIVKGHDGFLRVESDLGMGTVFEVYFPARSAADPVEELETIKTFRGNGEWVLVADDESSVRETLQLCLEHLNLNVLTAVNGNDALAQFEKHRNKIGVVLTDINMPVLNGLSLAATLRGIAPGIQIIAMSGLLDEASIRKLELLGVELRLHKPFKVPALVEALRAALSHPEN